MSVASSNVPIEFVQPWILISVHDQQMSFHVLLVSFIWIFLFPLFARWIWRFFFEFHELYTILTSHALSRIVENEIIPLLATAENNAIHEDGFFRILEHQGVWSNILRDWIQGFIVVIYFLMVMAIWERVSQSSVSNKMQVSIIGLLRTSLFSSGMIALAVGLGVGAPFILGKTAIGVLVCLLQITLIQSHVVDVLVPDMLSVQSSTDICPDAASFSLNRLLLIIGGMARSSLVLFNRTRPALSNFVEYIVQRDSLAKNMSPGKTAVEYTDFTALHVTIVENLLAMIAGYVLFIFLGSACLRVPKVGDSHAGHIIRQAGTVIKIVGIGTVEFVAFPIFSGILIDVACFPLFPNGTIASRMAIAQQHTFITTLFYLALGTFYIFLCQKFVTMCRDVAQLGTAYFVQDFDTVRKIPQRPSMNRLPEIGVRAIIHSMFIVTCPGFVVKIVELFGNVLPLQVSPTTLIHLDWIPISGPILFSYLINTAIKSAWRWWFQTTARMIRSSSSFFATRGPDEKISIPYRITILFAWMWFFGVTFGLSMTIVPCTFRVYVLM